MKKMWFHFVHEITTKTLKNELNCSNNLVSLTKLSLEKAKPTHHFYFLLIHFDCGEMRHFHYEIDFRYEILSLELFIQFKFKLYRFLCIQNSKFAKCFWKYFRTTFASARPWTTARPWFRSRYWARIRPWSRSWARTRAWARARACNDKMINIFEIKYLSL